MNREITGQDLTNIASEAVSLIEGAFGIGLAYEDVVNILCEMLIEKFGIRVVAEPESILDNSVE